MIRKVLTIAEIVLHPSYNYDTSENDIALLKVILLILSFDDDKFHITHLGFPSHFMLATVISLLFFTWFYSSSRSLSQLISMPGPRLAFPLR